MKYKWRWVAALMGITLGGCADFHQSLKGIPQPLSEADQKAVEASFVSSKRIAVVVGINSFGDSNWPDLGYPVKDANDFAAVLNDRRYGQFDRVILLTDKNETTRERILAVIDDLSRMNLSGDDTVIFYVSSHGTIARTDDGKLHQYVVARDSRFSDIPHTAVDLNELKTAFGKLKSKRKALIFAFCHSGQGKSQLDDTLLSELKQTKATFFVKPIDTASEATIVLAASAWGETAREDSRLENDIYTHFLIEGIRKQDRNGDGAITITEAHDYAREQTYYYTGGEQRPSIESVILGTDPIILAGEVVRTGKPIIYDYSHRYENLVVFVDGEKKGALPMGIAVDPGVHQMEVRTGDGIRRLYNEKFTVEKGEQLSIPLLLNGHEEGVSLRAGYQGFVTAEVDRSVAKPLMMYGLAYSKHAHFSPRLGFRADLAYGSDQQMLDIDPITTRADVSQTAFGVALLYRYARGDMAFYTGPRVGELFITRKVAVRGLGSQSDESPTVGGIIGMHFRHKKNVSLALEGTVNYATIELADTNTSSIFYNVFGSLSVNF